MNEDILAAFDEKFTHKDIANTWIALPADVKQFIVEVLAAERERILTKIYRIPKEQRGEYVEHLVKNLPQSPLP